MIVYRAIIADKKDNKYKIRIPSLHGISSDFNSVSDDNLPYALVSVVPGMSDLFLKDDVVNVVKSNDEFVILGSLCLVNETNDFNHVEKERPAKLSLGELKVFSKANLPASTSIGNITSEQVNFLSGVTSNIQNQFNNISNCATTYEAIYASSEFAQLSDWSVPSRGLIINSKLIDADQNELDTIEYKSDTTQEQKFKTSSQSTTVDGISCKYTKGYNNDYRLRLNWLGSNVVENDKTRIESGLYARNYWEVTAAKDSDNIDYVKSEYTWRPTIQGKTSDSSLKLISSVGEDDGHSSSLYTNGYYPYYLMLNPDGGDVHIGRGNNGIVIYDNDGYNENSADGSSNLPKDGLRIKSKEGGDILIHVKDNALYQIDLTRAVGERKDTKIGSGSGAGGTVALVVQSGTGSDARYYANAYINHNSTETFIAKGLGAYMSEMSSTSLQAGNIRLNTSLFLGVVEQIISGSNITINSITIPITATQTVQAGALLSGDNFRIDAVSSFMLNNSAFEIHFSFNLVGSYDADNDIVSVAVTNLGNTLIHTVYGTTAIQFNRGALSDDSGFPASLNVGISYEALVPSSDAIKITPSTIVVNQNESLGGSDVN